jgi:hypothetical protein
MVAPILPGAELLGKALEGKVDYIIVDRMNYNYADWVYKKYQLQDGLSDDFFYRASRQLIDACMKSGIDCRLVS